MGNSERKDLLESFRAGPARLRKAAKGLSDELLDFRPFADAWTIRENIAHLCDSEVYGYARHRKALAEPGARVDVWDEMKWHESLHYEASDAAAGLALFEGLRLATAALVERVAGEDWSGYRIDHPERGLLTLEQVVRIFSDHVAFHVDLVERNKRLWKEKGGR